MTTTAPTTPPQQLQQAQQLRRTRIVCISDTHNLSPLDGAFAVPAGDVLIHAGDLTNQGTQRELERTLAWLSAPELEHEVKIVVAGNHDITLDSDYYNGIDGNDGSNTNNNNADEDDEALAHSVTGKESLQGISGAQRHHSRYPQSSAACRALLLRPGDRQQQIPGLIYLEHEAIKINLTRPGGPQTTFTAFGSPFSPGDESWAFTYAHRDAVIHKDGLTLPGPKSTNLSASTTSSSPNEAARQSKGARTRSGAQLWSDVPLHTDIVVTHTPPAGLGDAGRLERSCPDLFDRLEQVRPKLAVCGHVHEGWGAQRVRWQDRDGRSSGDRGGNGGVEFRQGDTSHDELRTENYRSTILDMPRSGKKLAKVDLRRRHLSADESGSHLGTETCVVNAAIKTPRSSKKDSKKQPSAPRCNKAIVIDVDLPVAGGQE